MFLTTHSNVFVCGSNENYQLGLA